MRFVSVHLVDSQNLEEYCFILSNRSDFHMIENLTITCQPRLAFVDINFGIWDGAQLVNKF